MLLVSLLMSVLRLVLLMFYRACSVSTWCMKSSSECHLSVKGWYSATCTPSQAELRL